jgi:phosphatidylglycerol:prolipoprotein diacylglycerol transferase
MQSVRIVNAHFEIAGLLVIPYPRIPPTIFSVGPIALRWYAVMYIVAYVVGYQLVMSRIRRGATELTKDQLDNLIGYLVVGMLVGARLIYVFVYDPTAYAAHPWQAFALWNGGLSFHGAIVGIGVACLVFAHREALAFLSVSDTVVLAGTPGLFFGRLGNFINGELYGRPSNVPWAMIFPADPLHVPRHPSQLYEALAEGILLSLLIWLLDRWSRARGWYRPGILTAAFLVGYAIIRFLLEFTRQPDAQLGLIAGPFSMGQMLSAIMLIAGLIGFGLLLRPNDLKR